MFSYRYFPGEEQPEGAPELAFVLAESEDHAKALLHGEGLIVDGWQVDVGEVKNPDMHAHVMFIQDAPKRSRMRSAKDLYEEKSIRTSMDPWRFRTFFEGVVDEDRIPEEANTRVELRMLFDPYIDGERCCELYTMWFDGVPFGVGQEAGRGGRDHDAQYVTDVVRYKAAVAYLISLYTVQDDLLPATVIDADTPMRDLTYFYCTDAFGDSEDSSKT